MEMTSRQAPGIAPPSPTYPGAAQNGPMYPEPLQDEPMQSIPLPVRAIIGGAAFAVRGVTLERFEVVGLVEGDHPFYPTRVGEVFVVKFIFPPGVASMPFVARAQLTDAASEKATFRFAESESEVLAKLQGQRSSGYDAPAAILDGPTLVGGFDDEQPDFSEFEEEEDEDEGDKTVFRADDTPEVPMLLLPSGSGLGQHGYQQNSLQQPGVGYAPTSFQPGSMYPPTPVNPGGDGNGGTYYPQSAQGQVVTYGPDGAPSYQQTAMAPYGGYDVEYDAAQTDQTGMVTTPARPVATILPDDDEAEDDRSFAVKLLLYGLAGIALVLLVVMLAQVRGSVRSLQAALSGQVIEVVTPQAGIIQTIDVREGDVVTQGETLFVLDDREIADEINGLQAQVDDQEELIFELEDLIASERSGTATTDSRTEYVVQEALQDERVAQERLRVAQSGLEQLRAEAARSERLLQAGAINRGQHAAQQDRLSEAEGRIRVRQAELEAARRSVATARQGNISRGTNVGRLSDLRLRLVRQQAELRSAQSRLATLQRQRAGAHVAAYQNGRVVSIIAPAGSAVRQGQPVIALETTTEPAVVAYFPFNEARLIGHEQEAEVLFPARDLTLRGRVVAIGDAALGSTRSSRSALVVDDESELVPVRVQLVDVPAEQLALLQTGMQADVFVDVGLGTVLTQKVF